MSGVAPRSLAFTLALGYAFLACLYILFSDSAVHLLVASPEAQYRISVWKGFGFVLCTAVVLFLLIRGWERRSARLARELQTAELRWRFALEGAGHGVWEWNANTDKVFYSRDWKAMLGYADHEIGDTLAEWESRVHPEDLPGVKAAIEAHLAGGTSTYVSEHRVRCRDGSYKWILDRGRVIERTASGEPRLVVGTHTDVTPQRTLREALDGSRRFLSDLVENSDALVFAKDAEGRYMLLNRKWESITGHRREDVLGRTDAEVFPGADGKAFRANDEEVMSRGVPLQYEERLGGPQGSRHFLSVKFPLRDVSGQVTGVCGMTTEITERKRDEEALRASEARYRSLFQSNPQAMWVYDPETLRFLSVNDAACALYGYTEGEFLAMTIRDIRPAEDQARLARYLEGEDGTRPRRSSQWRHRHKDGRVIDVRISSHAIEHDGRPARLVLVSDVTEHLRLERERSAAEAKFRALSEQSLSGVYMVEDGRFIYINPRGAEILGRSPGEVIGHAVLEFVDEAARPAALERGRKRAAGEPVQPTSILQVRRKDGTPVTIGAASAEAILEGRRVLIGVMQDITDKAAAEARERDYVRRLEHSVHGTVNAVSKMMDLRDPYTAGHEMRVGQVAAAIAAEMGLEESVQQGLRIAGAVHDVGKITVPAEILSKPGRLTPAEFAIVKTHAQQGYEILKDIDSPWPLAEVARQHHERLDGSGYPRGLKGDEIALEARILAVADVVESMASHRPYRPTLGLDKALEEIEMNAGTRYDAAAAAACLRLFREKGYALPA